MIEIGFVLPGAGEMTPVEYEGTFWGDGNVLYLTSLFIIVDVCIRENSSNCRLERSMHFMLCNLKRDRISLLNC